MRINLNGRWEFRQLNEGEWMAAQVPGTNYGDLLRNGRIADPYFRMQELDDLWVGERDWEYRRSFKLSALQLKSRRQILLCEGLDTIASVFINDQEVAQTENMFRRYEFDAMPYLRAGKNEIRIVFSAPVTEAERRAAQTPLPVYASGTSYGKRAVLRKCQSQFGWDWGPKIPCCGIWKDISLLFFNEPRIVDIVTEQLFQENGSVLLRVKTWLDAPAACNGHLQLEIGGTQANGVNLTLAEGENIAEQEIIISDPQLWWPNGEGDPHLYLLTVQWRNVSEEVTNEIRKRIGIRQIELVREADEAGESFYFRVNGRPIFAKGANWIPGEMMLERMTREVYERDLRACAEANMNMVRLWGGGIYEKDDFYDICDELGLLVWHDFMFACSLYPAEPEFLQNVEIEARQQVRRLRDHACIALWCGNNENETMLKNWMRRELVTEQAIEPYHLLFHDLLQRVASEEDPTRSYWPSSPSNGGEGNPQDQTRGDVHYWEVWHGGKKFEAFEQIKPRFSSEFGFQSFPEIETLKTIGQKQDLNPSSPVMDHHQRSNNGNKNIIEHLSYHLRFPWTFDGFCYASQVLQAMAIQTAVEHWRRLKPYCMGTLYWQVNDCWPVASWSSIDYAGRWKALHYAARRFFSPLLVSGRLEEDRFELWATSDLAEPLGGSWSVQLYNISGERITDYMGEWNLEPLASRCIASWKMSDFLQGRRNNEVIALLSLSNRQQVIAENMKLFCSPKAIDLLPPRIQHEVSESNTGQVLVKLSTDKPALFVRLSAGRVFGRFSDNYMHLLPGRQVEVEFKSKKPVTAAQLCKQLRVSSLFDSYQE